MAHGDPGQGVEPADIPNESEALIIVSVASESPDGGGIPRVHLGGTRLCTGAANGCGNRTEGLTGQVDGLRGWMDTWSTSNKAETDGMSNGERAGTYLGVRDAKRVVNATDGVEGQTDTSTGPMDVPSIYADAIITANATEIVSTPPKRQKPPNSPIGPAKRCPHEPNSCSGHTDTSSVHTDVHSIKTDALTTANMSETVSKRRNEPEMPNSPMETAKQHPDEPNGCGSHADGSSARTHMYCVGNDMQTATNEAESVRTHQNGSMTQNSPNGCDIAMPKVARRWRRVSVDNGDMYIPWNVPIAIPSRKIVFGRVESGDEAIAPSVKGERAGEGDGSGYGDDSDVGDMTSGGNVDSKRVKAALLAGDSQLERQS